MSEPRAQAGRKRRMGVHRAIMEATLATLSEVGYQHLTLEGIAARAGVSKATLYRWWSGKPALVVEAISEQLGEPLQATGNTQHDVRAMVERAFEMVDGLVGEVLIADLSKDPEAGRKLEELLGPHRAAQTAVLLSAAGRGDLPYDVDAGKVIDLVAGIVLVRRLMNRSRGPQLMDEMTALILAGPLPRLPANSV